MRESSLSQLTICTQISLMKRCLYTHKELFPRTTMRRLNLYRATATQIARNKRRRS